MEALHAEIINFVIVILTACAGFITQKVVSYLNHKGLLVKLENNKEVVKTVVHFVEQTYSHLHGQEKLNVAKLELIKMLEQKKIKIDEKDIDLLIEATVSEMNKVIKKEI
ncbi:phage holin [Halobacillus rhizosphaerae]|uniref:phage holin n=1 Tax=Halobacillus rhizosphaerae TaxID=3064889 RepID=UPI00398B3DA9